MPNEPVLITCSHMPEGKYSPDMIKMSGDNVLNLCDECHAHMHNDVLTQLVSSALKEVFEVKVGGALG